MNADKTKTVLSYLRSSAFISGPFFPHLELNLAELVQALLIYNPIGGFQRAPGEAFPAARGVAERDGVRPAIEADLVGARNGAGAIGSYVDMARIARLLHLFHQLQ